MPINQPTFVQGLVSIVVMCDWLVDENSHRFPIVSPYPRPPTTATSSTSRPESAISPASLSHRARTSDASLIQVSSAISVSANLVASSFTPSRDALTAPASYSSAMTTPVVRSYSGAYTATPQSARVASQHTSLQISSTGDNHDARRTSERDSFPLPSSSSTPHELAPASAVDSRDATQLKASQLVHAQRAHATDHDAPLATPAPSSLPAAPHSELPPVGLLWKSIALQERGEAALAQLKVENESLVRQLRLQREEAAAEKARIELQLEQQRQQAVLEAAVARSRISGLEAQMASSAAAQEARLRRELALSASNMSDQMRLVKELGGSAVQLETGDAGLEGAVVTMKQQQLQLQAHVAQLQRCMSADSTALAAAEASIEVERKRVRDLEAKVLAVVALPTAVPNVSKLINAVIVEHPGGGPLSLRERRLVSIIEAMELEISEMHVASDAMIEAFSISQVTTASPGSKPKSALEGYEEQRELLLAQDRLKRAEQTQQYLAAQVAELTRVLDLERMGADTHSEKRHALQHMQSQQESPHKMDAATPFGWLSQAPGPGEQERLSRNSAVVSALETAISLTPDAHQDTASVKAQLKVALSSFWQMEIESLLLRRRLFQTSALIEASADRLHAREKLLSDELTACRQRHDDTVSQLRDAHLSQCLQLSKQAALFQVQCEIKDIVAQELKSERDAALADLKVSQAAACSSSIGAFNSLHARLLAIAQEAARLKPSVVSLNDTL